MENETNATNNATTTRPIEINERLRREAKDQIQTGVIREFADQVEEYVDPSVINQAGEQLIRGVSERTKMPLEGPIEDQVREESE